MYIYMDLVSITTLVVAVGTAILQVVVALHIKKCNSICCDSDCMTTRPNTPIDKQPLL
jgi:hypothetical protein